MHLLADSLTQFGETHRLGAYHAHGVQYLLLARLLVFGRGVQHVLDGGRSAYLLRHSPAAVLGESVVPAVHILATRLLLIDAEVNRRHLGGLLVGLLVRLLDLDDREYLRHLALCNRTERADELRDHRVLVQDHPQARVVVGGEHHTLADDRLAFDLVVVVAHKVEHTVEEDVGRTGDVYRLQYLAPAFQLALGVAEPEDAEVVVSLGVVAACHDAHAVLHGDGVVLALLGVDVEHHGVRAFLVQRVERLAVTAGEDSRHEHLHQPGLAVTRFAGDDMQVTDIGELDTIAAEGVARRCVAFGEVEEIALDLGTVPVVTLQEVGYFFRHRHFLVLLLRDWVFICCFVVIHFAV